MTKGMMAQAESVVIEQAVTNHEMFMIIFPLEHVPAAGSHVALSGLHCNKTVIIAMKP